MLSPMEKDAAIEVVATIRANLYRHKEKLGDSEQVQSDREVLLCFKDKIRFESELMTWDEVLIFSKTWLDKYPASPIQSKKVAA